MTDPLYRILMTCALFFGPFTRPCYCCSYRSRYSASYTPLTHLTRKQTTKTVQPTKHATADKRTIARSTVTAFNLQSFIEPPSHGTTITPLKHTLDSQNTDFKTRHRNQIPSFRHAKHKNSTDLSKHIWTLKNDNIDYSISWRVLSSSSPYNSSSKRCNLCLKEKFLIICRPNFSSLNKRNELVSSQRRTQGLSSSRPLERRERERPWYGLVT